MKIASHLKRGGAALAAVLIMIILIAAGTAIMVVSGRGQIKEAGDVPYVAPIDSSSTAEDESVPDDSSEPEPEPEKKFVFPAPVESEKYQEIDFKEDNLSTKYGILVDADKNEIIAGMNYDKQIFPASLTKVMALVVAVENIEDRSAEYKFTQDDISGLIDENASRAGFEPDESVPFTDLLYAAILPSGADGTLGISKLVAGSEEAFVELMNKKAEELELENTHFMNASGLHDENHYSTCKDMATILSYAIKNKLCRDVLTADQYTTTKNDIHPEGLTLYSLVQSRLIGYWVDTDGDGKGDADIIGGKTGFTDEAGFCFETILDKDGTTYFCVTAKSTSDMRSIEDNIAVYENYID